MALAQGVPEIMINEIENQCETGHASRYISFGLDSVKAIPLPIDLGSMSHPVISAYRAENFPKWGK